jgi:hypothetical protein
VIWKTVSGLVSATAAMRSPCEHQVVDHMGRRRATTETETPGANDAARISRFSASGHGRLCRRPVAVVPTTDFVDTSHPHIPKNQI